MRARLRTWKWRRSLWAALGLAAAFVLLAHPLAHGDVWANVGPASPLGAGGLDGRYQLGNYSLDEHFSAVSAGVFSGVDVSGVGPMVAYFFANEIWQLTAWLANTLIDLFGFAFSLDLVNGSAATNGAGALAPVSRAIHSVYSTVFGGPWMVLAVSVAGLWAMWKALVQRRYAETAGQLALSLIYVAIALFFVFQPAQTIGAASKLTNEMSGAFLSIAKDGSPGSQEEAKQAGADELFGLLVAQPWSVLQFGGLDHCVKAGSGSGGSEAISEPVQPLPAQASRRLEAGEEVSAAGKVCIDNAKKYGGHFLRFEGGSDERNEEFNALSEGDSSELPDADPGKADGSYKLGAADVPAAAAMEEGGQYQRLLVAIVIFGSELGAFCLLGALSVGVILAQVLLLLLLAFSPVALVAAAIPGRGHQFFKAWLSKLGGYLLRKAAYSLILAILLAVCAAIAAATSALGWLLSFGLQSAFFWAVFVQRRALTESLVGIATGPSAPGRERALSVLALYYGARTGSAAVGRPLRAARHGADSTLGWAGRRLRGGGSRRGGGEEIAPLRAKGVPPGGVRYRGSAGRTDAPEGAPSRERQASAEPRGAAERQERAPSGRKRQGAAGAGRQERASERGQESGPDRPERRQDREPARRGAGGKGAAAPSRRPKGDQEAEKPRPKARKGAAPKPAPARRESSRLSAPTPPVQAPGAERSGLSAELRAERERAAKAAERRPAEPAPPPAAKRTEPRPRPSVAPPARPRRGRKGRRFGKRGRGRR